MSNNKITVQYRLSEAFAQAIKLYSASVDRKPGEALEALAQQGCYRSFEEYLASYDWQNAQTEDSLAYKPKQYGTKLTSEAQTALAELGLSTAEELVYLYFGLEAPAEPEYSCMSSHRDLAVLTWQSQDDLCYSLAPCHPYMCSVGQSRDEAYSLCTAKIDEILDERSLSKTEAAIVRKARAGCESILSMPGKQGVALLASSLQLMATAYGYTSRDKQDSAFLLACVIAEQDSAVPAKSKEWACNNMAKYLTTSEAIEQIISEAQ